MRREDVISSIKQVALNTLPPNSSLLLYGFLVLVAIPIKDLTGTCLFC